MTIPSWSDLAGIGVYAFYIGGAYLLVFVALAAEIALVVLRHRNIRRYLADGGHEDSPVAAPREPEGRVSGQPGARP